MKHLVLTVATPEGFVEDATHMIVLYGLLQGENPSEWQKIFTSQMQDNEGNLYRVFSHAAVSQVFIDEMVRLLQFSSLQNPPVGISNGEKNYTVDIEAANRAHNLLRGNLWLPTSATPLPKASPDKIIAVVGIKGIIAVSKLGLVPFDGKK